MKKVELNSRGNGRGDGRRGLRNTRKTEGSSSPHLWRKLNSIGGLGEGEREMAKYIEGSKDSRRFTTENEADLCT